MEVLEYENPCKQLKIGSQNYASAFKKSSLGQTAVRGKQKLNVKAANGWKLTSIVASRITAGSSPDLVNVKSTKLKNGGTVDFDYYFQIDLNFKNTKTKGEIKLTLSKK